MRDRGYYRNQRRKHIKRKKNILKTYGWHICKADGTLNKGKVHCSCGWCRRKTNNKGSHCFIYRNYSPSKNWKPSDKRKIERMKLQMDEYLMAI